MDIFEKAREAEEAKGKARDAYKKAEKAMMATPEYKDYIKAKKAFEETLATKYTDTEEADKALWATSEYKDHLKAWEAVKATPEWKAAEKAWDAYLESKKKYEETVEKYLV